MSVEVLDKIKQETQKLSPKEKAQLKEYLSKEVENNVEKDLGLAGDNKSELRKLHKNWLKANRQQYAGNYVALDGDKLIAKGKTKQEANQKAVEQDVKNAFVVYVYPLDYVGEIGGF